VIAAAASVGLASSLMLALPAYAQDGGSAPSQAATVATRDAAANGQTLAVSSLAVHPAIERESFAASNLSALIASTPGVDAGTASVIASDLQPGTRLTIVQTALSYLGDPYVLGGSDHSGIDCSGLTMQAYASVGIPLVHLVSAQDVVGTAVPASAAQPGDLVVFDSDEHIGLYLGGGLIIHAPDVGRPVEIEPVSAWDGTPHHFTRILPS